MEVGQGPNWGCSAKEKNQHFIATTSRETGIEPRHLEETKVPETDNTLSLMQKAMAIVTQREIFRRKKKSDLTGMDPRDNL
jgi:hypothetical protein